MIDDDGQLLCAFWNDLNELRREQGLSYVRLEHRTNIPHSTIQYWMTRSVRLPPWLKVRALVHALKASEEVWLDRWRQVDRAPHRRSAFPASEPAA